MTTAKQIESGFVQRAWQRLRSFPLLTGIVLTFALAAVNSAQARVFFNNTDPALNNAVIVPLDETRFMEGQTSALLNENGTEFQFNTANPNGFFGAEFFFETGPKFITFFPEGVVIDINPAVGAIGFQFRGAECTGVIEVVGVGATENFAFPPGSSNAFVGAGDIGDITQVTLNGACFAAIWLEMRFVPSTGAPPPGNEADIAAGKQGPGLSSQEDGTLDYTLNATNLGPDPADNTQVVDFLASGVAIVASNPPAALNADGDVSTQTLGTVAPGVTAAGTLSTTVPPFSNAPPGQVAFNCQIPLINYEIATSGSLDANGANNLSTYQTPFDRGSRSGVAEICNNGIDDNCNDRIDCGDFGCSGAPNCRPPVMPNPNNNPPVECPLFPGSPCLNPDPDDPNNPDPFRNFPEPFDPDDLPPPPPQCETQNIHGDTQLIAPCCCSGECNRSAFQCRPRDPNFKDADPPVNAFGFGYTDSGHLHSYTITYENIGGVPANDVRVLDVLHDDLDDTTLVVSDGGSYDPATRTIQWIDPVVAPADPQTVSFEINVDAAAIPGTRIRNVATVLFPDAAPPTRIDTNFVEHSIVDPRFPVVVDPGIVQCVPTGNADEWTVSLFNRGFAFGFNVSATIINLPAPIQLIDPTVQFGSVDDPAGINSTVALGTTSSLDTVAFATSTPNDPCRVLTWRIAYETEPGGPVNMVDVQVGEDGDEDAVTDNRDNCPVDFNPTQIDSDNDGLGDACDAPDPQAPIDDLNARPKRGKVSLTWPAVADAVSYNVYRGIANGGPYEPIAQGHISTYATYLDTDVDNGTTYYYVVRWIDAAGNESGNSNQASATPSRRAR